ncbi:MAG: type II secretion system protein [Verrucomicrobiales bacterium]
MKTKSMRPMRLQGFTLVELLVVIVIIAALASIATPAAMSALKKAKATTTSANAKEVQKYMLLFDQDYQSFPDRDTADEVESDTGTNLNLSGNFSNDYFRQIVAWDEGAGEKIFYAETAYTRQPDGDISPGRALAAGEVGFGYIMDGDIGQSMSSLSTRPLLVAPLLNAGTDWQFDRNVYGGKAIVLRIDGSVEQPVIRKNDNNIKLGRLSIQSTGDSSVWGNDVNPQLRAPQKRGSGGAQLNN